MTSIKKSVVIPLEKYNRLLSHYRDEPRENKVKDQNSQILYQAEEEEQTGRGTDDTKNSKWLFGIPSLFKRNVVGILDHLRDHKDVLSWNDRGEIVYKGRVILGSNLTDLLKDSQRRYKNLDPYGDREFYRAWAELNIPEGLLGNDERKTEVRHHKNFPRDHYIPPPPGIPQKVVAKKKKKPVQKWLKL